MGLTKDFKSIYLCLTSALLFVFALMFPIIDLKVIAIFAFIVFAIGLYIEKSIAFDFTFLSVLLTFVLIAYIDWHANVTSSAYFAVIIPISYFVGKYMVGNDESNMNKRTIVALAAVTLGSLIQGFLNYWMEYQEAEFYTDNWTEFWTGKEDVSRSLFEYHFVYFTCLIGVAILVFKRKKILSLAIVALDVVIQILIAKSEGRMNAGILLGVVVLTLMIYFFKGWKNYSQKIKRIILGSTATIIALIIIFYVLFLVNAFGIQDTYLNSYLNSSGGFIHNIRFAMMLEGLKAMRTNPLGGWSITIGRTAGFVNSTWFIFAQEYDDLIFILLMFVELFSLIDVVKLIRTKLDVIDYWLIGLYAGVNVYFWLETCPWRYRNYFVFIIMLYGIIGRRVELKKDACKKAMLKLQWNK